MAGLMWERLYRDVLARADKAEWLSERMEQWSGQWGLKFDLKAATQHWHNRYGGFTPTLVPWYEARIEARSEEMRKLRAEAAEAECNALMAEIERLQHTHRRYESGRHAD